MYKMTVVVLEYTDLNEELKGILIDMFKYNAPSNGSFIEIDKSGEFNKLKFSSVDDFDAYTDDGEINELYSAKVIFFYRELCKLVSKCSGGAHDKVLVSYCW